VYVHFTGFTNCAKEGMVSSRKERNVMIDFLMISVPIRGITKIMKVCYPPYPDANGRRIDGQPPP
jgi:hypothetical protein